MEVSRLTIPLLNPVMDFLSAHEKSCVSLVSHIVSDGMSCLPPPDMHYYVFSDDSSIFSPGRILAVMAFSDGGLVLHCIDPGVSKSSLAPFVEKLLSDFSLFCVLGEKSGTDFIASIAEKLDFRQSSFFDYTLMHYEPKAAGTLPFIRNGVSMVKCTEHDANDLFPLQKGYDLEERLPPGYSFYPSACMRGLEQDLKTGSVLAFRNREGFMAKALYNAVGLNWVQIGGVYTMPEYRRNGYAHYLVRKLSEYALQKGKKTALFVKNRNKFARKAYESAGFVPDGAFKICYF